MIPGDEPQAYQRGDEAKQIVEDAEKAMHSWEEDFETVETRAHITAGAAPASTSQESSAEVPAAGYQAGSQTEESVAGEPETPQRNEDAASDRYSHISANDGGSPMGVHSMSAPRMDASTLERPPAAIRTEDVDQENQVDGVDASNEASGLDHTEAQNKPVADEDFAIRPKKRDSGVENSLDAQQRVAVPI